jgi:DNA polymerase-1
MTTKKQRVAWGHDEEDTSHDDEIYLIRKLFIPARGFLAAADAAQIEYRLFADYAKSPKILAAYEKDPWLNFHRLIYEMIRPHKPDLVYKQQKNLNFARLYGGGLIKLAEMLGYITEAQGIKIHADHGGRVPRDHPLLQQVLEVDRIYSAEMPEVSKLSGGAQYLAQTRGYVRTLLGRRMRFPEKKRIHKALNGVIQGSAADILKRKMVEVHRERKRIGFTPRMTVHDEIVGDTVDRESASMLAEVLNRQSFDKLTIPILWETSYGSTWASCKSLNVEEHMFRGTVNDSTRGDRSR